LVVLRIFSRAKSKTQPPIAAPALPGGGPGAFLLPSGAPAAEPGLIRRQIAQALQQDPEQVRQMFRTWIQEKE
jgi:hypothetical protein